MEIIMNGSKEKDSTVDRINIENVKHNDYIYLDNIITNSPIIINDKEITEIGKIVNLEVSIQRNKITKVFLVILFIIIVIVTIAHFISLENDVKFDQVKLTNENDVKFDQVKLTNEDKNSEVSSSDDISLEDIIFQV
jgi:hypothetical protein